MTYHAEGWSQPKHDPATGLVNDKFPATETLPPNHPLRDPPPESPIDGEEYDPEAELIDARAQEADEPEPYIELTEEEADQAGYEAAKAGEEEDVNPCEDPDARERWSIGWQRGIDEAAGDLTSALEA